MNDPRPEELDEAVRDHFHEQRPSDEAMDRWLAMARPDEPQTATVRWLGLRDSRAILLVAAAVLAWLGVSAVTTERAPHNAVRPIIEVESTLVGLVAGAEVTLTIPDQSSLDLLEVGAEVDVTLHQPAGDREVVLRAAEVRRVDPGQSLLRVRIPEGVDRTITLPPGASLSVSRTIDKAKLQEIVKHYSGQLKYCYESVLKEDADLGGRVVLRWTIAAEKARDIEVEADTVASDELTECMTRKIARWRFEGFDGPTDVTWPFVFRPGR